MATLVDVLVTFKQALIQCLLKLLGLDVKASFVTKILEKSSGLTTAMFFLNILQLHHPQQH